MHIRPGDRCSSDFQIARATYELLNDEFVCEPRGTLSGKGKGEVETWYSVGRRSAQA